MFNSRRTKLLGLLLAVMTLVLACRTVDTIAHLRSQPTAVRARATKAPTRAPTRAAVKPPTQESAPTAQASAAQPTGAAPTPGAAARKPTPTRAATARPVATTRAVATTRPTNTVPAPTPTSQFAYQVAESRCGPNVRTYIEGYVYENGAAKNGVLVRISQGPDGQPDPNDDFLTGTDKRKGYYFQNIDANAPHEGTWYLWVLDQTTKQRISTIAIVKTDATRVEDTENSSGSCQSATVNFSNQPSRPVVRTPTPSRTRDPNATPTVTPTQDTLNDS